MELLLPNGIQVSKSDYSSILGYPSELVPRPIWTKNTSWWSYTQRCSPAPCTLGSGCAVVSLQLTNILLDGFDSTSSSPRPIVDFFLSSSNISQLDHLACTMAWGPAGQHVVCSIGDPCWWGCIHLFWGLWWRTPIPWYPIYIFWTPGFGDDPHDGSNVWHGEASIWQVIQEFLQLGAMWNLCICPGLGGQFWVCP